MDDDKKLSIEEIREIKKAESDRVNRLLREGGDALQEEMRANVRVWESILPSPKVRHQQLLDRVARSAEERKARRDESERNRERKMSRKKEVADKIFEEISSAWSLSDEERTRLLEKAPDGDSILMVSYLMGIYRALHTLYEQPAQANSWVRRPNRYFDDQPALDVMLKDPDGLKKVRQYLDAQLV